MTQLVGRILRQPYAEKTKVPVLDECYVITHHADTAHVVAAIKKGLEKDGLGDLVKEIRQSDTSKNSGPRKVKRRQKFIKTEIFLPQVLRVETGNVRPLDYEQDILFELDWSGLNMLPLAGMIPNTTRSAETQLQRIRLADTGDEKIVAEEAGITSESLRFDPAYVVRMISDIVPNAWVAREIVGKVEDGLVARGFDPAKLGEQAGLILEELRKWLDKERDRQGEAYFKKEVASGRIQFRLRSDGNNWRMPFEIETSEPEAAEQLINRNGSALERSLFAPIFKNDFSSQDERDIAVYLDGNASLHWWHRNVARSHFSVQGWRRDKIYPDFIFALQHGKAKEHTRLLVLEMKGEHLSGNAKTEYVKKVLSVMSEAYTDLPKVGELELIEKGRTTIQCDLVLMSEWKTKLPEYMN
jgi:type III restriction enzyme